MFFPDSNRTKNEEWNQDEEGEWANTMHAEWPFLKLFDYFDRIAMILDKRGMKMSVHPQACKRDKQISLD